MAFGQFQHSSSSSAMAEINMVPLIDVMLVLLVIFLVTAPMITHRIPVDLPRASAQAPEEKPETIRMTIDRDGRSYWNGEPLPSLEERQVRLANAARRSPAPVLELYADSAVPYEHVALALRDAAQAGLSRIGFVTDPRENPAK